MKFSIKILKIYLLRFNLAGKPLELNVLQNVLREHRSERLSLSRAYENFITEPDRRQQQ